MQKNSINTKIVIMAGGKGERFWPKSRLKRPKQFANIITDKTMLEDTVERLLPFVTMKNIYVSVGNLFEEKVKNLLPKLADQNVILEPQAKDTAAAIALAVMSIESKDDDVFFFIPADHYISNLKAYHQNIEQGSILAQQTKQMVLLGIPPTSPSENFGYIEIKPSKVEHNSYSVVSFKEKPDAKTAQSFLTTDNYLWNAGMFFMRKDTALTLFQEHIPTTYQKLEDYSTCKKQGDEATAQKIFASLEKISFDYAVVEKIPSIFCIKANFVWDDVGTWNALARIRKTDADSNLLPKNAIAYQCKNVLVDVANPHIKVVLNGVEELNVVLDDNVLYLTSKQNENEIKKILQHMREDNQTDLL